ncbi:hypothetical protein ACFO5X_12765 [Seohaeicola nanhaiensis]|uniref:Uncharacterized protein n=1 Tax=Seohaeicola nanhaiensis TaxID=1387282 RepID=A0ABV9KH38_9RHOB
MEELYVSAFEVPFFALDVPQNPRENQYRDRKRELVRQLVESLSEGQLLSSAVAKNADPSGPRFAVHPAHYISGGIDYQRWSNSFSGAAVALEQVEIFEPEQFPRNIRDIPDWLSDFLPSTGSVERLTQTRAVPSQTGSFDHDDGYAHVTLQGVEYTLNPIQAGIVRVLHQSYQRGQVWVRGEAIRNEVKFDGKSLSSAFRYMKNRDWQELIVSDRRGAYRLNL